MRGGLVNSGHLWCDKWTALSGPLSHRCWHGRRALSQARAGAAVPLPRSVHREGWLHGKVRARVQQKTPQTVKRSVLSSDEESSDDYDNQQTKKKPFIADKKKVCVFDPVFFLKLPSGARRLNPLLAVDTGVPCS